MGGLYRFSNRLQLILRQMQPKSNRLIDVGCDHGLLSLAAVDHNLVNEAIASDIRRQPLERAEKLIAKHGLIDKIKTIQTAGLENIDYGVGDTIVIAGMGGVEISSILKSADLSKLKKVTKLILHPTKSAFTLRKALNDLHLPISNELLCREARKIYTIITVDPDSAFKSLTEAEIFFGPKLLPEMIAKNILNMDFINGDSGDSGDNGEDMEDDDYKNDYESLLNLYYRNRWQNLQMLAKNPENACTCEKIKNELTKLIGG